MNINELGEDLEQQFGKPRNITEENVKFMLSLIKEEFVYPKNCVILSLDYHVSISILCQDEFL